MSTGIASNSFDCSITNDVLLQTAGFLTTPAIRESYGFSMFYDEVLSSVHEALASEETAAILDALENTLALLDQPLAYRRFAQSRQFPGIVLNLRRALKAADRSSGPVFTAEDLAKAVGHAVLKERRRCADVTEAFFQKWSRSEQEPAQAYREAAKTGELYGLPISKEIATRQAEIFEAEYRQIANCACVTEAILRDPNLNRTKGRNDRFKRRRGK